MSSSIPTRATDRQSSFSYSKELRKLLTAIGAYCLLAILAFLTLIPIIWMILSSFKSQNEVLQFPPRWLPQIWHPDNYIQAINFAPFGQYLLNTLFIAISVTATLAPLGRFCCASFSSLFLTNWKMLHASTVHRAFVAFFRSSYPWQDQHWLLWQYSASSSSGTICSGLSSCRTLMLPFLLP